MQTISNKIAQLFQINFTESEINRHSSDGIRRIKMVNTISLIGILNLTIYGVIYSFIDFKTYSVAIAFYFCSALLTFSIIIINKNGFYHTAKILLILIFPFYLTVNSTLLFGKAANSQVYILLFALIPLFVYSFKQKLYLISFIGLNLIIYFIIEFLPSFTNPKYGVPLDYVELFRSINVFVAFLGAFVAIIYFKKYSNQKELQLIKQAEELKTSRQHRDIVYSVIAHDLRSPFNGLIGLSDMLVKQFDELEKEKLKKYISSINVSATNLNSLLINLLDWSKMQSGNLKVNFEAFKVKQVVDDVISLHTDLLKSKELKLINNIDADLIVFADVYMVSTVIRNLLTNAIKFTPESGTIEFNAKRSGSFIELSLRDTGIGIPQTNVEELLCLNCNYNTTGTNNEKGSGLGLKLCKDFVVANGGEIWLESIENKGSCFYFTLKGQN